MIKVWIIAVILATAWITWSLVWTGSRSDKKLEMLFENNLLGEEKCHGDCSKES